MNNPGVWKNSGIRELVSHLLKALMDRQERAALKARRMYVGFEKNEKYYNMSQFQKSSLQG